MFIDIAGVGQVQMLEYHLKSVESGGEVEEAIVLVDRGTEYDTFVTWTIFTRRGARPEAFWGHYFSSRDEAFIDFHKRANTSETRRKGAERLERERRAAATT